MAIADSGVYRAGEYADDLVGEDVVAWASEGPSYRRPSWMSVAVGWDHPNQAHLGFAVRPVDTWRRQQQQRWDLYLNSA